MTSSRVSPTSTLLTNDWLFFSRAASSTWVTPAARRAFEKYMRFGPREFSWFIFRVTNPTMREFFMYPQNPLRVKEALMGLLAGDIHGKTPLWNSLRALKGFYFVACALHPRRSWNAWRRRRRNVRDLGALVGENVVDAK